MIEKIKQNKIYALIIVLFVVVFATIFFFRQFNAKKKFEITNDQKAVYRQYYALVENRIAFTELLRLNHEDVDDLGTVISNVELTNQKAMEIFSNEWVEVKLENTEDVQIEALEILEDQNNLLKSIKNLYETISPFMTFSPGNLLLVEIELNKEEVIESTGIAHSEISRTREAVDKINFVDTSEFSSQLTELEKALDIFIAHVEGENYSMAKVALNRVINQSENLKIQGLEMIKDISMNDTSVKILTKQTNLILKYKFYLDNLDRENYAQ